PEPRRPFMDAPIETFTSDQLQSGVKRILDLCGALIGLILFGPLFLLITVLLQIETPGKIFYRQERLGYAGVRFGMLKFRTMRECAEEELGNVILKDPKYLFEYERYQKLAQDPRLTRVGRILRKTSLDELPQLWNVLVGEMSLVGPRPFLPGQLALYGPTYLEYQRVLPGLTGLWQVSGRNRLTFQERVCLDEKYIQEWSIRLDLEILARTPWAVIFQVGAC
ncbi:MAG: sugar transferase, partial [Omnitrophica WOR_2 bacterium]